MHNNTVSGNIQAAVREQSSRQIIRDSTTNMDQSPDRNNTPMHFLPTLPENQNVAKHGKQPVATKKHSSTG